MRPSVHKKRPARVVYLCTERLSALFLDRHGISPACTTPDVQGSGDIRKQEWAFLFNDLENWRAACLRTGLQSRRIGQGRVNLVCFTWLDNHTSYSRKMGFPKVNPYPTMARFTFGDRRVGEVRHAAEIKVGIAGRRGAFAACVLDADIPTLLRRGALEAIGGQLDF